MGTTATIVAALAFLITTSGAGWGETFHGGHTGACEGCHGPSGADSNYASLLGPDPSSTCLRCHAAANPKDYQIATEPAPGKGAAPKAMSPAGDFAYLKKTYTWTNANGSKGSSPGERHGHNIIAAGYGYVGDTTLHVSPGGTYPSETLSCISCHDPHGNYRLVDVYGTIATDVSPIGESGSYGAVPTRDQAVGSYRLLAGKGYKTKGVDHVFANDPPIAVAPTNYNRSEADSDTRVAYGKGVSKWCANCHEALLQGGGMSHQHPSDAELGPLAGMYNNYLKSGDLSGMQATAYTSLVPFQTAETTDPQQLAAEVGTTNGPNPNDRVTCLTCHRAHASGWDSIARWNTKGTFITVGGEYPGVDGGKGKDAEYATGKSRSEYKAAMYNRDSSKFAVFQRQLCNKCHARD